MRGNCKYIKRNEKIETISDEYFIDIRKKYIRSKYILKYLNENK